MNIIFLSVTETRSNATGRSGHSRIGWLRHETTLRSRSVLRLNWWSYYFRLFSLKVVAAVAAVAFKFLLTELLRLQALHFRFNMSAAIHPLTTYLSPQSIHPLVNQVPESSFILSKLFVDLMKCFRIQQAPVQREAHVLRKRGVRYWT